MPEIKSLPLCCATAESVSSNCCIATCLHVAQAYLMGTSAYLKKGLSGDVSGEKRKHKWVEGKKKKIIEKKKELRWRKEERTKWGEARKSDCKRNVGLCKSIHLGSSKIYTCISTTWIKWDFMFQFFWHFLFFNETIFICSARSEFCNNEVNISKDVFEHWCPF